MPLKKPFLQKYNGETIQELLAMKDTHRIGSLVLAVEEALMRKVKTRFGLLEILSEVELVVLAVEALEREVNNGGYKQFFWNSSREFTSVIVRSLELIDCSKTAAITSDAITALALPKSFDADIVRDIAGELSEERRGRLAKCDARYFKRPENIEERLFAYIELHQKKIAIP
jgi:hypothetical protein